MIIKYISLILGAAFEIYCINIIMHTFCDMKAFKKFTKPVLLTAITVFHILISCFAKGIILMVSALLTAYCISLLYKSKQYIRIILSIAISVITIATEQLFGIIFILIAQKSHIEINITPETYAMEIFLSELLVYIIILIVKSRKFVFNTAYLSVKYRMLLSILPLTAIILCFFMSQIVFTLTGNFQKIICIVINILLILSNAIIFEIIRKQNELTKTKYDYQFLKETINEQTKHYSELQLSHEEIRRIKHDMNNTYLALMAEIESGNTVSALNHIKHNLDILDKFDKLIDTGHPAVDAILENKIKQCDELNIKTEISYSLGNLIQADEYEIAVVIGNILDNAIEACKKLPSDNKEIWGLIYSDNQNIIINIKNTAENSNHFKTSKPDKKMHGIGLKSIQHIAKEHNGYAKFSFEDDVFKTFVIFDK